MSDRRLHGVVGVLLSLALATSSLAQQPTAALALTNVHVVDVQGGAIVRDQVVVIRGDRIVAVGRRGAVSIPRGGRVVDGGGGFVIPGLWDLHVHLTMAGRSALPVLLAAGVTGVRDMGGDHALVRAWQDSIERGALRGPRIVAVGAVVEHARWRQAVVGMLTSSGDSITARSIAERFGVLDARDAARAADSVAALGARLVKVRNSPPRAGYFALLREARARGIEVVGHPPSRDVTLREASDSGQRSIEHLLIDVGGDGAFRSTLDAMPMDERTALYARLRANGTALVPTLVAGIGMRRSADSAVLAIIDDTSAGRDPRRRYVSPQLAESWRSQIAMKRLEGRQPDWESLSRTAGARLRELDAAGVAVLAGTDLGTPLTYPGFALHDELELQVREGGRSAARTLWGATLGAAALLGREGELGVVAEGRVADLVLLSADPLRDIANVRTVRAVVRAGDYLDRGALDALLREGAGRR